MSQDLATRNPAVRARSTVWPTVAEALADAGPRLPLHVGDVVLDLTGGDRETAFLAASIVGRTGRIVGLEDDPAALVEVRRAAGSLAERLGYANVEFLRGRIDDLALDPERLDAWLETHPVRNAGEMVQLAREMARLRREEPLIADHSVDAVITMPPADCVAEFGRRAIAQEISRVLRPGGRLVCWERERSTS